MDANQLKKAAGIAAAKMVESGMIVGLGTGSTVHHTIVELGRRVKEEGLKIKGIPTSLQSEKLAKELGIPLTDLDENPIVDITIDGADEFDMDLRLIKGGGGALTREKIVAHASNRMVVVADESKKVEEIGSTFALPVEVIRLGLTPVKELLEAWGATVSIRERDGKQYLTDNGNPILDAKFEEIEEPETLATSLDLMPGVVCHGLFLELCDEVVMAGKKGIVHFGKPEIAFLED